MDQRCDSNVLTDAPAWQEALDAAIEQHAAEMVAVRRHLHMHPEPSGCEQATTQYLLGRLRQIGPHPGAHPDGEGTSRFATRFGPEQRGLIVEPSAPQGDGPCIGLRADIDALHIDDDKQVDYRSKVDGVMHACGHDAHTAMTFGAILALDAAAQQGALPWPVNWRAIFQPAEESAVGAREMVDAGAADGLRGILALHVDPTRRTGTIGVRAGNFTADCQEINIHIHGQGGHASRPHESRDPIAAAAQLITSMYQFVHRTIDSQEPVVVTIGQINGGSNYNAIPDRVFLRGTLRCFDRLVKEHAIKRIDRLASGIATASDTTITIEYRSGPPAVRNDAAMTDLIRRAATELLGEESVQRIDRPSMGGEDFANYLEKTPGAMFRLGCAREPSESAPLHSPRFDIDEAALPIGAKILARTAVLWSDPKRVEEMNYVI